MKLSIIIPVYRTEATLDRCMESVIRQTFSDFEVILVDDGSPDGCPKRCDEWALRDGRIRVLHKQNGGLSDARNAGIAMAKGDFMTFVDSDDCLDDTVYAQAMALAEDNDIAEFAVMKHLANGKTEQKVFTDGVFEDMRDYWLRGKVYRHCYAWNKIFRRRLFDGVRFPKGRVFEDVATLPLLLAKAARVAVTSQGGCYHYCWNADGITAKASGNELRMLLESHLKVMDSWTDDEYYMHVLNIQMDVCETTGDRPALPLRRVSPMAAGLEPAQRAKAAVLNTIGIEGICRLNKTLHSLKLRRS